MKKLLILLLITSALSACAIHKLDIQQGNVLTPEMIGSLKVGMDKRKVEFIMGTAPLKDPFHPERWDYVYTLKRHGKPDEHQHITLFFDQEGKLARIVDHSGNDQKQSSP